MTVVRLGALCEFAGEAPQESGRTGLRFDVSEWAQTSDGVRVVLHEGVRGFGSVLSTDDPPWSFYDATLVISGVLSTVLPDGDDGEEHPWSWLVELLAAQGIVADEAELRAAEYVVELGPGLTARLGA